MHATRAYARVIRAYVYAPSGHTRTLHANSLVIPPSPPGKEESLAPYATLRVAPPPTGEELRSAPLR